MKKKTYYIFLSSERNIKIDDEPIDECLNKTVLEDVKYAEFKCIKRGKIQVLLEQMKSYYHHSFLLADANVEADAIAYCQLGYAYGKDIKVIGYDDGRTQRSIKLQEDFKQLVGPIFDPTGFIDAMRAKLHDENWNGERVMSEKSDKGVM